MNAIRLLRPKQWIKNVLVFAALVFSKNLFDQPLLLKTIWGFLIFCGVSSCVYIINDTVDREKDRQHPKKRKRPIASGAISVPQAMIILTILAVISFIGAWLLSCEFALTVLIYFVLNLCYSFGLKNAPIIDIMCVAIGFVLRALAGSFLISNRISPWLLVCTLLLSLFLSIHKRKSEIKSLGAGTTSSRKVLEFYTEDMLRDMSSTIDSATIMAYCLYTFFASSTTWMMTTIPFVIYGLFRYQYIIHTNDLAETPELALFKDKPLLIDVVLWGILCILLLCLEG